MKTKEDYLAEICIESNLDKNIKSVVRYIKAYYKSAQLFLELTNLFSEECISKESTHGKSDSYRINNFLYEFDEYTIIVRTFSPLLKGSRPNNKIEVEILK